MVFLRSAVAGSFACRRCGLVLAGEVSGVNWFLLYLVLLKATVTSFSGLASVPIIRDELVVQRHILTDDQLNMSIA